MAYSTTLSSPLVARGTLSTSPFRSSNVGSSFSPSLTNPRRRGLSITAQAKNDDLVSKAKDGFQNLGQNLKDAIGGGRGTADDVLRQGQEGVENVQGNVEGAGQEAQQRGEGFAEEVKGRVGEFTKGVESGRDKAGQAVEDVAEDLKKKVDDLRKGFEDLRWGKVLPQFSSCALKPVGGLAAAAALVLMTASFDIAEAATLGIPAPSNLPKSEFTVAFGNEAQSNVKEVAKNVQDKGSQAVSQGRQAVDEAGGEGGNVLGEVQRRAGNLLKQAEAKNQNILEDSKDRAGKAVETIAREAKDAVTGNL